MRLYLIRHGQTPYNVTGALDTAFPGAGLTPLGHTQARALPKALADQPVHGIYASPLIRTQLTAGPLADAWGMPVRVQDGLEEVAAGELELRSDSEAVHAYATCVAAWIQGDLDRGTPGGTDGHTFFARYETAVRDLTAAHGPDDTLMVFSHGAAIRAYTAYAAGLAPEVAAELRIRNTGASLLEGDPRTGWRLSWWSAEPLGGPGLSGDTTQDVTGDSAEDEAEDSVFKR